MENCEQIYLQKTLSCLESKLKDCKARLSLARKHLKKGMAEYNDEYGDLSRGGDLSNAFAHLGAIEENLLDLEREERKIATQIKSPYFARIDFKPNGKKKTQQIYIGIGNVLDGEKLYVADWRAPVSSMYYDFNVGEASFKIGEDEYRGNIELKRQYKIENSSLISYFDTELTINDEILQDILSKNVSTKMKQIVSSIQKEQNTLVRNGNLENVLVQGVAGSGKTSIALHRAAYLLYRYKKQ